MKYDYYPFKIIHDDQIILPKGVGFIDQQTFGHFETFPKSQDDKLPVLLRWTYRAYHNDTHLFSIIGEGKYELRFDFNEDPDSDVERLIKSSVLNLDVHFQTKSIGTPLAGRAIPAMPKSAIEKIVKGIVDSAKSSGLLKE